MKYLIADLVTEFEPKYSKIKKLALPFEYNGNRQTDISLSVSNTSINNLLTQMVPDTAVEQAEEFALAGRFAKSIIKYNAMLIHSSALEYGGKAYLFSAESGIGKSTHTALWRKAFGEEVRMINDDKPVVRIYDDKAVAYGTPFDGGSGIAENIFAPLGAVVFLERGEINSVRKPKTAEIIRKLYFSSARFVDKAAVDKMLKNFDSLLECCDFYILTCNTDISAAYTARNAIIK